VMAENMGIVAHPEVHILIPIHIPDFRTLCPFDKERVGRKVMDVMGDSSRHHLFGPLKETF